MQETVTPGEAARQLGVRPAVIRERLAKGRYAGSFKDADGTWRIPAVHVTPDYEDVPLFDLEGFTASA